MLSLYNMADDMHRFSPDYRQATSNARQLTLNVHSLTESTKLHVSQLISVVKLERHWIH